MIAAIYVRKSTSQERASEEARSTTRQVELARAFAERQGWAVGPIYKDEAISGGEIKKRPGLAALLTAARATPRPIDIVVMMAQSRLARRMRYAVDIVHDLTDCGVRIFFYQTGQERKFDTATNRFMGAVDGFSDESYRENIRITNREVRRRKVERGEVGGGRVLGYINVGAPGSRRREVDPGQAAIVRRIFELTATGKGLLRIARTLNEEHVPNPTGHNGSTHWSATGIREVLRRELYLGRVIDGKTRREDRGESKVKVPVLDESQWIVRTDDGLRILSDELWKAAHDRMAQTHAAYLRHNDGKLCGRPASGIESKYLLSGLLRCGECGSNMVVNKTQGKRGRPVVRYVCANHKQRPGSCSNKRGLSVVAAHEAVLAQLRHEMTWAVIADRLSGLIEAPAKHEQERASLTAKIADLDRKLSNLADAMEATGGDPLLAVRMKDARGQRDEAAAKLEHLDGLTRGELPDFTTEAGRAAWGEQMRPILADLRATLEGDPAKARQRVKEVLPEPITATAYTDAAGLTSWTLDGVSSFEAVRVDLGSGEVTNVGQVSRPVAGRVLNKRGSVDAVWCPRGDSNTRHAV